MIGGGSSVGSSCLGWLVFSIHCCLGVGGGGVVCLSGILLHLGHSHEMVCGRCSFLVVVA